MVGFVSARGVVRRFGAVVAVDEADLEVPEGTITALLGPSGCGKTTLLRLIGGLDLPDAGTISVDGTILTGPGTFLPPERRQVVMVFQDFALFPHMSVEKNVAFGFAPGTNKRERVAMLLDQVGLAGLEKRMPHELSGGQQQRVALARALGPEPRLILLDEPFSNLDPSIRARVRSEVRQLIRSVGITAVFVTHDQDEALSVADHVAVMNEGKILQVGTPREIYTAPASRAVAGFIGQPNFLAGEVADGLARCELGVFPATAGFSGPADVMIRPEDLYRCEAGGVPVEVVASAYFGHEQQVTLRLPSGALVKSRWRANELVVDGARLSIDVRGDVHAFPAS